MVAAILEDITYGMAALIRSSDGLSEIASPSITLTAIATQTKLWSNLTSCV